MKRDGEKKREITSFFCHKRKTRLSKKTLFKIRSRLSPHQCPSIPAAATAAAAAHPQRQALAPGAPDHRRSSPGHCRRLRRALPPPLLAWPVSFAAPRAGFRLGARRQGKQQRRSPAEAAPPPCAPSARTRPSARRGVRRERSRALRLPFSLFLGLGEQEEGSGGGEGAHPVRPFDPEADGGVRGGATSFSFAPVVERLDASNSLRLCFLFLFLFLCARASRHDEAAAGRPTRRPRAQGCDKVLPPGASVKRRSAAAAATAP